MKFLKKITRLALMFPIHFWRRLKARRALARIATHPEPRLRALGIALKESLSQDLSEEEKEAISLIEKRRTFLLKSDEDIEVIDYGAGSGDANRTKEEMEEGVKINLQVAKVARASKPQFWATVLFKIIRKLGPHSCVELGSCVGISGAYQASALRINGQGAIISLEGLNTSKPIDFFFNDGHHDQHAVIRYFEEAMPYLSDGAVIVFDDITWSKGMKAAWSAIESDSRVSASIDLGIMGIALVKAPLTKKVLLNIPL
jgi:predicted O-methyltransferase YrrM